MESVLAAVLLVLLATWLAWLAGWVVRVELSNQARELCAALSLRLRPEGMALSVEAEGEELSLRWTLTLDGVATWKRTSSGWRRLDDAALNALRRDAAREGNAPPGG